MSRKTLDLGLSLLAVGLFLSGARLANAETITVQSLNGPTPSGSHFAWNYNTALSDSGEIKTGDYVEVDSIPGFINTPANNFVEVGFGGTTWNISYTVATQEVEAVYSGNKGTVVGPVTAAQDLVELPFLDTSSVRGGGAEWGSDDHAAKGNHIGQPESAVVGQFVDAPLNSVPLPHSLWGSALIFSLLASHRMLKNRAAIA